MQSYTQQTITLEQVARCIKQDPVSWNAISLFYVQSSKEKLAAIVEKLTSKKSDTLVLYGSHGDCLVLGAGHPPSGSVMEMSSSCLWIADIASEWEKAYSVIEAMVSPANLSSAGDKKPQKVHPALSSILIVEDDVMISTMMAHHLKPFGTVIATGNSRQAMANYNVQRPDMVLLDIHYKDDLCDGFDVLANILSIDANAFVVMVSADRNPATVVSALARGAQGFIAKPFCTEIFSHYFAKFAGGGKANSGAALSIHPSVCG